MNRAANRTRGYWSGTGKTSSRPGVSAATWTALPLPSDLVEHFRVRQDPFPDQDSDDGGGLIGIGDGQLLEGDEFVWLQLFCHGYTPSVLGL